MSLLLQSEISAHVADRIRGHVARVGGRVDQLISYRDCQVTDINVIDGGFGNVQTFASFSNIFNVAKRYARQEVSFWRHGTSSPRDRKTIILDMHAAFSKPNLRAKFDCSISSNMLEHSPNPIWLLLNFHFITKESGIQYHALPHYKYTYDCYREPTKLNHFIEDFEKMTDRKDTTHNDDYIQSAIVRHGWQKTFHEKYPVAYPFMHFHVFDENNVRDLFQLVFTGVTNDVQKDERFSDNLVICNNQLNPEFKATYDSLIRHYLDSGFVI